MIKTEKRAQVLKYALELESVASEIAAFLLDIPDAKNSLSFGNRSSSLSFNQKLNLLKDNDTINKDDKYKLEVFAAIRNQFMHNPQANNYVDAFDFIDGAESKLKKIYPQFFEKAEREVIFENIVEQLYKDGRAILVSFKGGAERKIKLISEAKTYRKYYEKLNKSVIENFKEFEDALRQIDKETIDKSALLLTITEMKFEIVRSPFVDMLDKSKEFDIDPATASVPLVE